LTVEAACAALRKAGFDVGPADVAIDARDNCWTVSLPHDRLAWFPKGAAGERRLAREGRVLKLLEDRCSFQAPRILYQAADFDLRAIVAGRVEPWSLYSRIGSDAALARRHGRALGSVLAQQHTRISQADVAGWVDDQLAWPEPRDWIRERLPEVVGDSKLVARIDALLRRYESTAVDPGDRALVHGDFGLHNVVTDPSTDEFRGIFDYGDVAWTDRHHDFRYLVFDVEREGVLEGALETYEQATGRRLDRDRIAVYHAACAASFLAFRRGVAPHAISCGRTLAEDLGWIEAALRRIGL
jgi:aminoglycoside phosphotransferase (APT) family kinase protein